MTKSDEMFAESSRPHIAHITNHGYPGVTIPVGGAPDTGGQVFYVNSLATTMDKMGYKVTVFARGGFPHFDSETIRKEPEYLSPFARYVYVPGGGPEFLRKEDIGIAMDEEIEWLDNYIRREAKQADCEPWEVYEFVNSHYWDAAVIGVYLVERWQNDLAHGWAEAVLKDQAEFGDDLKILYRERHRHRLAHSLELEIGKLLLRDGSQKLADLPAEVRAALKRTSAYDHIPDKLEERIHAIPDMNKRLYAAKLVGAAALEARGKQKKIARADMKAVDTHVWTMHSLGSLKERNYLDRDPEEVRTMKFCERRHHEEYICKNVDRIASTSPGMTEVLHTIHGFPFEKIFFFPPCIDRDLFRPYEDEPLERTYAWLSETSGIDTATLKKSKIVFETSRMDSSKRKDVLLQAFAEIAASVPDAYLFIGGGPQKDIFRELQALAEKLPALAGRAFLTGFIPDECLYPIFALADVFVSASEMEGFGMSASQAAAAGTALISSDLIPFSTQFAHEDTVIVESGNVQAFAEAVKRLLTNDEERSRRGKALFEKTKELSWPAVAASFIEHLRKSGIPVRAAQP